MHRIVRNALAAATVVVAIGLALPAAATAAISGINERARDPELAIGVTAHAASLYRFQELNRVGTAWSAAVNTDYPASGTALGRVALLASSTGFADALAAAPLAAALSAPVLLADADGALSPPVAAELATYDTVIIVSGRSHIPESTADALRSARVEVTRYAGSSRYDTAAALGVAALYWENVRHNGGRTPAAAVVSWTAYLADGRDFPDGLAAGPAAAHDTNGVVLLTGKGELGGVTEAALRGRFGDVKGVDQSALKPLVDWWNAAAAKANLITIAVGGEAAQAADASGVTVAAAFVGADRYETAAQVAARSLARGIVTGDFAVASGTAFPDAVVAGAFAGNLGGSLLLTRAAALPQASADVISSSALNTSTVVVFGGEGSVSREVSRQLITLLKW